MAFWGVSVPLIFVVILALLAVFTVLGAVRKGPDPSDGAKRTG